MVCFNQAYDEALAGWQAREAEIGSEGPCGGWMMPCRDIPVSGSGCSNGTVLRKPVLAWVWRGSLSRNGTELRVATSIRRLSGANRHAQGSHRTLGLLDQVKDDPDRLFAAFLLAGVLDLERGTEMDAQMQLSAIKHAAKARLGLSSMLEVWARSGTRVYPGLPDAPISKGTSPFDLGKVMRDRHEAVFQIRLALRLRPVASDVSDAISQEAFFAFSRSVNTSLHVPAGRACWHQISNAELQDLVWKIPRSRLEERFDISDNGIRKRCRRAGIVEPPRGYWQKLTAGRDPRPLLENRGITPPAEALRELDKRFGRSGQSGQEQKS